MRGGSNVLLLSKTGAALRHRPTSVLFSDMVAAHFRTHSTAPLGVSQL